MRRCDELGAISDEPGRLTRTFHSPAMSRANALVGGWMREAGLEVREDAAFNVIGRWPSPRRGARTLLLGSHLDTVRDAGRYDGPLGVLVALAAVEHLRESGASIGSNWPFHIEVAGFSDEEGVRYQAAYLGSGAMAGTLTRRDLARISEKGIERARRKRGDLLAYIEAHIEQGPVLEQRDLPVGVVSAIAGQSRIRVEFHGRAGHAGTTPMGMRQDALCGAAEFVLTVERFAAAKSSPFSNTAAARAETEVAADGAAARMPSDWVSARAPLSAPASASVAASGPGPASSLQSPLFPGGKRGAGGETGRLFGGRAGDDQLVATVGQMSVEPGASNVIPGTVVLSLDVRHARDARRVTAVRKLEAEARAIARRRRLTLVWSPVQETAAVRCDPALTRLLSASVARHLAPRGRDAISLPSGAGHDAVALSSICPVAMLFVRCKGGVSHHPDESVRRADVECAIGVMADVIRGLAARWA
jgi:acetylornithine deacetylase/succinyl-diaminopimelate desuccinylase-like protein